MITKAYIYSGITTSPYIYYGFNIIEEILDYIFHEDHYVSSEPDTDYQFISSRILNTDSFKNSKEYSLILQYISSNLTDIRDKFINSKPSLIDHFISSILLTYYNRYSSSKPSTNDYFKSSSEPYTTWDHFVSSKNL